MLPPGARLAPRTLLVEPGQRGSHRAGACVKSRVGRGREGGCARAPPSSSELEATAESKAHSQSFLLGLFRPQESQSSAPKRSRVIRIRFKTMLVDKEHTQASQLEGSHSECPFSNRCNNLMPLVSVSTVSGLNGPCSVPSDSMLILGQRFYAHITAANCKALVLDPLECLPLTS